MFGKKGVFRNAARTKSTLFRILGAWIVGQTKQVGGWLVKILFKALSFIPFVGPVFAFLSEFGPAIYTFITTQLLLIWQNKQAESEEDVEQLAAGQKARGESMMKKINTQLHTLSKKVVPFKNQTKMGIPGLQTANKKGVGDLGGFNKQKAIVRQVPLTVVKNDKPGRAVQKNDLEKEIKADEDAITERVNSNN